MTDSAAVKTMIAVSPQEIVNLLPFVRAVEMERAVLRGETTGAFPHIWWVTGCAAAVTAIAVFAFLRRMKRQ